MTMISPSADRSSEDRWKVLVVGQGLCGARISAAFSDPPSFLPVVTEQLYPLRCYVFDTDGAIKTMLVEQGGWPQDWVDLRCFIVPTLPEEEVAALFLSDLGPDHRRQFLTTGGGAGIGGHPVLGREAAKNYLRDENLAWRALRETLRVDWDRQRYLRGGC